MAALEARKGPATRVLAEELLRWTEELCGNVVFGMGATQGSFIATPIVGNTPHYLFAAWTIGTLEVHFQYLASKGPFRDSGLREELRQRLNKIQGVSLPPDARRGRPSIALDLLAPVESRRLLMDAFEWVLTTIRNGPLDDQPVSSSTGLLDA